MSQPKRIQTSPNEGNILLAISAFRSGQYVSMSATIKTYKVPKTTLISRIKGRPTREDFKPQNKRMSTIEEEVIVKNILKLDAQGLSPTIALVKEMADSICKAKRRHTCWSELAKHIHKKDSKTSGQTWKGI